MEQVLQVVLVRHVSPTAIRVPVRQSVRNVETAITCTTHIVLRHAQPSMLAVVQALQVVLVRYVNPIAIHAPVRTFAPNVETASTFTVQIVTQHAQLNISAVE